MPETKTGTCPWCDGKNKTLYSTSGWYTEGNRIQLWTDYICADCRWAARRLHEETEPSE